MHTPLKLYPYLHIYFLNICLFIPSGHHRLHFFGGKVTCDFLNLLLFIRQSSRCFKQMCMIKTISLIVLTHKLTIHTSNHFPTRRHNLYLAITAPSPSSKSIEHTDKRKQQLAMQRKNMCKFMKGFMFN